MHIIALWSEHKKPIKDQWAGEGISVRVVRMSVDHQSCPDDKNNQRTWFAPKTMEESAGWEYLKILYVIVNVIKSRPEP